MPSIQLKSVTVTLVAFLKLNQYGLCLLNGIMDFFLVHDSCATECNQYLKCCLRDKAKCSAKLFSGKVEHVVFFTSQNSNQVIFELIFLKKYPP